MLEEHPIIARFRRKVEQSNPTDAHESVYLRPIDPSAAWTAVGRTPPRPVQREPSQQRVSFQTGDCVYHTEREAVFQVIFEIGTDLVLVMDEKEDRLIRAERRFLRALS
jgi:hypothetical protein